MSCPRAPLPADELTSSHFWECCLPSTYSFPFSRDMLCLSGVYPLFSVLGPVVLLSDSNPSLLRTVPVLVMNVLCSWIPSIPGKPEWLIPPLAPRGTPNTIKNEWAQGSCWPEGRSQYPFLWKRSQLLMALPWGPREEMAGVSVNQEVDPHQTLNVLPASRELWEINISCL